MLFGIIFGDGGGMLKPCLQGKHGMARPGDLR